MAAEAVSASATTRAEAISNRDVEPLAIAQLPQSLRIVAFSDCHVQNLEAIVVWVKSRLEKPDLIIYAGDEIRRFVPDSEMNYFEQLASLSRYGIVAVAGNDDLPKHRDLIRGHKVYEVHSRPVAVGPFLVVGVEGSPILEDGTGIGFTLYTELEIAQHLQRSIPEYTDRKVIIVSHAPPRGCLDEAMRHHRGQIGSTAVREVVEKDPRVALVVSGHVHLCGGHHDEVGRAVVVNAASSDTPGAPARIATFLLHPSGAVEDLEWTVGVSTFQLAGRINGIGDAYASRLAQVGITTIEHLADATLDKIGQALGRRPEKTRIFVARARAHLEGRPFLASVPKLPEKPHLYLDIETDLQQSYTWLVGVATEEGDEVRQFFAPHPSKESEMLQELAAFLAANAKHSVMHFSGFHFDRRILVQRMESYSMTPPPSLLQSTDCLVAIRPYLALPSPSLGLTKAVECFGYRFAYPELDGWNVAYEYQQAIESGSPVPDRLLAYNRDDVLALRFLIQEVEQLADESSQL